MLLKSDDSKHFIEGLEQIGRNHQSFEQSIDNQANSNEVGYQTLSAANSLVMKARNRMMDEQNSQINFDSNSLEESQSIGSSQFYKDLLVKSKDFSAAADLIKAKDEYIK